MDGAAVRPYNSSNDFEARLRDLGRNTFLSHNSSLFFWAVLARRGRRYPIAVSTKQVRAQG
jgi:hypothetical protein